MFTKISEKVADRFISKGTIEAEDRELYQFGIWQIINFILNIGTALVIGFIFNGILNMLLFGVAFIPIRSYAGGYHAKTPQNCFVLSVIMLISVMLLIKFISFTAVACIILMIISALIILIFSPTETDNKPLDETEKKVYRGRTLILLTAETIAVMILLKFNFINAAASIILALLCLSLLLIAGRISNLQKAID